MTHIIVTAGLTASATTVVILGAIAAFLDRAVNRKRPK